MVARHPRRFGEELTRRYFGRGFFSSSASSSSSWSSDEGLSIVEMLILSIMTPTTQRKKKYSSTLSVASSSTCGSIFVIPTDIIIYDILVLMEPNTLTRLRCASKWWNTLISHPAFSLLYYRFRSLHQLPHQIHWYDSMGVRGLKCFLSTTDSSHPQFHNTTWTLDFPEPFLRQVSDTSCLGLICLYDHLNAYLYNPTTRAVIVSLPPYWIYTGSNPILLLGFAPSTNQFKVIHFSPNIDGWVPGKDMKLANFMECSVLTVPEDLEKGWRKVACPVIPGIVDPVSASAEGAIYILNRRSESIFRFDLEREIWSDIKFPTHFRPIKSVELRGYLCLVIKGIMPCYEIWMRREGNVWAKVWELNECLEEGLNESVKEGQFTLAPLHYDEKRGRLLVRSAYGYLSWYWIKEGTYDKLRYLFKHPGLGMNSTHYVETLVSLETLWELSLIAADGRAKRL